MLQTSKPYHYNHTARFTFIVHLMAQ